MTHATMSLRGIVAFCLFFIVFAFGQCLSREAKAQTVGIVGTMRTLTATSQDLDPAVSCTAAAASRWLLWLPTGTQRNVMIDVVFTDADSSAASLGVRCETTNSSATAADAGQDLPTITATASTGVSSMTQGSWSWVATGGGAPGSSTFVLQISNIPNAFIGCLFTCGAGAAAADTIQVTQSRGINP